MYDQNRSRHLEIFLNPSLRNNYYAAIYDTKLFFFFKDITEPGIISKVLLANADALCAAAVPLMDPDDALM